MAACMTVCRVLTLLLLVSISGSVGRPQCAEVVDDPRPLFSQSKVPTDPVAEYVAEDLAECMSFCCYEELSCNVGVFTDSSSSDTNCWLYTCHPLDSCSIKIRKRAQTFVDPHSTDVDGMFASANTEHSTSAYEDNNVDDGNNDDNTDYTTPHYDNETYYTDEGASDTHSTPESTIISSPPKTSETTGNYTPQTTSESTGNYTPPSASESTGNSTPLSTSKSTGSFTPPFITESNGNSTPPSVSESTGNYTSPSISESTGNYTSPFTSEATIISSPSPASEVSRVATSEMSRVVDIVLSTATSIEFEPEETPVWLASENNTFVSLVNKSATDTPTTPGNDDVLQNDTAPTSLNQTIWENNTNSANFSEEIKGNNTLAPLFTQQNDTAKENENATAPAENKYNVRNDTVWLTDQLTSNESSLSLSPSETELSQTLATSNQVYYSIQPTLLSEDSALFLPANTTSYSSLSTEASILSSSELSTLVTRLSMNLEPTKHLSALDDLVSSDVSGSAVTLSTGVDVSSSLGMLEDGEADWPGYTQTSLTPGKSAAMTPDLLPPVSGLPQNSQNDTETRADINYQPSEATTGLLISALAVGCVCVLAVVGVLSLRLYDGYKKRHYSRLDYLVNGIYN